MPFPKVTVGTINKKETKEGHKLRVNGQRPKRLVKVHKEHLNDPGFDPQKLMGGGRVG